MKHKYSVLIIGAGSIGAFFDTPTSKNILTHAHAFKTHKGFNLVGFVDTDEIKARKAASVWGCSVFGSANEAFDNKRIDVACVAVPDACHYSVLKKLSKFPLRLVLSEKPLTSRLDEAKEIIRAFKSKDISIAVNYSRRFVPEFEKIKMDIEYGKYGRYLAGTGYYGKGIMHNGSHLINLLEYFIGGIKAARPIDSIADFYPDDKSVSAVLTFENGRNFFLQNIDCRKYTLFEMDLLFEKKRIRIVDLGFKIEVYDIRNSKYFKGYKNIVKTSQTRTSLDKAMYHVVENMYSHLSSGEFLKCSAEDAYKTMRTCLTVRKGAAR